MPALYEVEETFMWGGCPKVGLPTFGMGVMKAINPESSTLSNMVSMFFSSAPKPCTILIQS